MPQNTIRQNGRKYILDNVTLTIPSNKSIAILGSNGAGKSTLPTNAWRDRLSK